MSLFNYLIPWVFGAAVSAAVSFSAGSAAQNTSTLVANPNVTTADGNATISLKFIARDAFNNIPPGVTVSFAASGGNNTFSPATGTTDANGVLTTTLSSTLAQSEVVSASFGASYVMSITVQFAAGPPAAAYSSFIVNPNVTVANNSNTLVALLTLKDAKGNPAGGVVPAFTASGTSTTIVSAGATASSGQTSATCKTSLAQNENALVTAGGLSFAAPMSFVPGPVSQAASSLVASPNALAADGNTTTTLSTTARDAQGNAVSGASVSLSASGGNNTFGATSGTTATNGAFSTTLSSILGQTETITAIIADSVTETAAVKFAQVANTTTSAMTVSSASQTVGPSNTITATLTLRDAQSNPIANISPTWTATGSDNTIVKSGNTNASGVATATYSSTLAQTETAQVVAGAATLTKSMTFVAGSPNATKSLMYTKPARQLANNANTITAYMILRDAYGNAVANQAPAFAASGTATTVTGNGNSNASGVATASFATSTVQNQNASGTAGAVSLTAPLIFTGVPLACALSVSPASVVADGLTPMTVTATVTGGMSSASPIGNALVTFSSAGGATQLSPGGAMTDVSGVATTRISSRFIGPNTFTARAGGVQCTAQGNFTLAAPYCTGNPNFTVSTAPVGTNPEGMTVGDLNNDGMLDLLVANYYSATVGVLLGNGDGTFQTQVAYRVPSSPYGIAAGDIDSDGNLDVVTTLSGNAVSVLAGAGDGTLAFLTSYPTASAPVAISLADVDADGALDVISTNYSSSSISVLLGTNTGYFLPAVFYATFNKPNTMIGIGDFNNDGVVDVVAASNTGTGTSVLVGSSPGKFKAPVAYATSNTGSNNGVAVGDFDADGRQDYAVCGNNGNIDLLLGTGTGTFAAYRSVLTTGTGISQYLQVDDFNGDGIADIVVPNQTSLTVSIILGTGQGNFAAAYASKPTGAGPYAIASGDFNGDGKRDFAVANRNAGNVSIYLNGSCDTPSAATSG